MKEKIKIGITQGDINSINYELIIKTFLDNRMLDFCTPIIYGSPKVSSYYRKTLAIQNSNANVINSPNEANSRNTNLINCLDDNIRVELGKATETSTEAALKSLDMATNDLAENKIDALITCPINNNLAHKINNDFINHKNYLSNKFNTSNNILMYVNEHFKIGLVSDYVEFSEIEQHITEQNIINKLNILNKSIIEGFSIRKPKIGIFSLNPYVSNDKIGKIEKEIIIPAINKANKEANILAIGPFSANEFYSSNNINKFDAVLAMYYDQGITPIKANNFGGINYFAGLPKVIIEPNFNLSYDIAGMNKGNESPLREAIFIAKQIAENKKLNKDITKDPIPFI